MNIKPGCILLGICRIIDMFIRDKAKTAALIALLVIHQVTLFQAPIALENATEFLLGGTLAQVENTQASGAARILAITEVTLLFDKGYKLEKAAECNQVTNNFYMCVLYEA